VSILNRQSQAKVANSPSRLRTLRTADADSVNFKASGTHTALEVANYVSTMGDSTSAMRCRLRSGSARRFDERRGPPVTALELGHHHHH
jgi:hypothetical protein